MSLKGLNQFVMFDVNGFLKDKYLAYVGVDEWKDSNGNVEGSKVRCVITDDQTNYPDHEERNAQNIGQPLVIKTRIPKDNILGVGPTPFSTRVVVKDVEKATVYGDFRNELSITGTVSLMAQKD